MLDAMQPDLSRLSPGRTLALRDRPILASVTARDHHILTHALRLLGGTPPSFGEALRAVRAAVEELIPAGRVYHLGTGERGPIVGSLVSGVGITEGAAGIVVVRVDPRGRWTALGTLSP
jgi:hypothetical protein